MIVIYDHNDSGLFHETTIVTKLALTVIVKYDPTIVINDHKVCYKLKRTLRP